MSNVPDAPNGTNRPGTHAYAPKQPELPAWLETLRSSERPPGPANSANSGSPYSIENSIDENALPSWMRSDMMNNAASAKLPAMRPASRPAPNTEGGFVSPASMSASSLIDKQSLPSWMQEPQALSQAPTQVSSQPQVGQQNISAANLVQQEALPHWMKALPEQQQPAMPSIAAQTPSPYASPAIPQQGLSGNDLIDQQGLPAWMSAQAPGGPVQTNGVGAVRGMTAGSLIDANALPTWLREGAQQEQRTANANANMAPGILGMGAAPIAPVPQAAQPVQPMQPMQPVQSPNMNQSISASSFVDVDALPAWLRPAEDQRSGNNANNANNGQQARPGAFGVATRGENIRVPSRPRMEMPSTEESAVAANVFASMLGVASATPNIPVPGMQPNEAIGRGQPQNGQPSPSAYPVNPAQAGSVNVNTGNAGMGNSNWSGFPEGLPIPQLPPLAPPPGYAMPMPQSVGNNQPTMQRQSATNTFQGNQSMPQQMPGNTFAGNQGNPGNQNNRSNRPGMQQQPSSNNVQGKQLTGGQQKQNGKKRGFLDTIMSWFSFPR